MINLLRPKDLKPLFKWTKCGVVLLHPQQHINLEKIEQEVALNILDNLLEQEITKYQKQDIKEVIQHLTQKN